MKSLAAIVLLATLNGAAPAATERHDVTFKVFPVPGRHDPAHRRESRRLEDGELIGLSCCAIDYDDVNARNRATSRIRHTSTGRAATIP
jgi:hypothetical protein